MALLLSFNILPCDLLDPCGSLSSEVPPAMMEAKTKLKSVRVILQARQWDEDQCPDLPP